LLRRRLLRRGLLGVPTAVAAIPALRRRLLLLLRGILRRGVRLLGVGLLGVRLRRGVRLVGLVLGLHAVEVDVLHDPYDGEDGRTFRGWAGSWVDRTLAGGGPAGCGPLNYWTFGAEWWSLEPVVNPSMVFIGPNHEEDSAGKKNIECRQPGDVAPSIAVSAKGRVYPS